MTAIASHSDPADEFNADRTPTGPRALRPARGCRISSAPSRQPRLDRELDGESDSPSGLRGGPRSARHLHLVSHHSRPLPFRDATAPGPRVPADPDDLFAVRATPRAELVEPAVFGRYFVQALLEVLSGRRQLAQLARHTSAGVQAGLTRSQQQRRRFDLATRPPAIHSLRVMEPVDGVAEVTAVVQVGPRFRAIAARMEGLDGRWRCTRLQLG